MRFHKILTAALALVVLGAFGCDLYPGSKYDQRFSVMSWDDIDSGDCLAVGTYVMDLDLGSPPFQYKTQVKLTPQFKEDREFLPSLLNLRYTQVRTLSTIRTFEIPIPLKNGKGKYDNFTGGLNLLAGDEINIEACAGAEGEEGTSIPSMTRYDLRLSYKFDK